jgi:hypothetical protein
LRRGEAFVLGVSLFSLACEPCAGTPSCTGTPEVGYSGQFIEHRTGAVVPGVRVEFMRTGGADTDPDTMVAISGSDGFFQLRGLAHDVGDVIGSLRVIPPPPHPEFIVPGLQLKASRTRGSGQFGGRLVVDPYILLVGEVRDRITGAEIVGATVNYRRTGGPVASPEVMTFVSEAGGRFFFEPAVEGFGILEADVEISAPGYPRPYLIPIRVQTQFVDAPAYQVTVLRLGTALQYAVKVLRRGSRVAIPGVEVDFKRVGGIPVEPAEFTQSVPFHGVIPIQPMPLADGEVIADITIRPPAPFLTEVLRGIRLQTSDGDSLRDLGLWGYGTQIYLRSTMVNRATNAKLDSGIQVVVRRLAGVAIDPDGVINVVQQNGLFEFAAATPDTGRVSAELEVRLRAPFDWDTIGPVEFPSRRDSNVTVLGESRVGRWLPWFGELRDLDTSLPISGATIEFRRTSGVGVLPSPFVTVSEADGRFFIQPLPLRNGEVIGDLFIDFPSTYRDTTITGLRLATSKDDTLRLIGTYRFRKLP